MEFCRESLCGMILSLVGYMERNREKSRMRFMGFVSLSRTVVMGKVNLHVQQDYISLRISIKLPRYARKVLVTCKNCILCISVSHIHTEVTRGSCPR